MKIGLIIGEICESHRRLIWQKTNLVWIDPTRDMSPFQINEFKNRINGEFDWTETLENKNDETLYIWTNNQELINSGFCDVWRVDNGKLFIKLKKETELSRYEVAARNWDIY